MTPSQSSNERRVGEQEREREGTATIYLRASKAAVGRTESEEVDSLPFAATQTRAEEQLQGTHTTHSSNTVSYTHLTLPTNREV